MKYTMRKCKDFEGHTPKDYRYQNCLREQKCPICEGRGILPNGFYNPLPLGSTTSTAPEICKRCGGIGTIKTT